MAGHIAGGGGHSPPHPEFSSAGFWAVLRAAGIKCVVFNPFQPHLNSMMNYRDHRKITVPERLDEAVALAGDGRLELVKFLVGRLAEVPERKEQGGQIPDPPGLKFTNIRLGSSMPKCTSVMTRSRSSAPLTWITAAFTCISNAASASTRAA